MLPPRSPRRWLGLLATAVALADTPLAVAAPEFIDLGRDALPRAISADGSVVAGVRGSVDGNVTVESPSFRWTRATGRFTDLALIVVNALSSDGSTLAGGGVFQPGRAFRWTEAAGLQSLLNGDPVAPSTATAVSDDGSVIVGTLATPTNPGHDYRAFRWTPSGVTILEPPAGFAWTEAAGVSGDGATVVGTVGNDARLEAFRWTPARGIELLGTLPGAKNSRATTISADGRVILGTSDERAFRWTAAGGMVALAPDVEFEPVATSADGSIVAGNIDGQPYRWDANHGLQSLSDLLRESGLDLTSWTLQRLTGLSADGATFVGEGHFHPPGGKVEPSVRTRNGWLATNIAGRALKAPSPRPTPATLVVPPPVLAEKRTVTHGSENSVIVRGTARGDVTRILYRVEAGRSFRVATGTRDWRFSVVLRPGANVLTVVAEGPGGKSAPARVVLQGR